MSANADPKAKLPPQEPSKPGEPRPPLLLSELTEMLTRAKLLTPQQAKDIEGRETTLRSRVLKDRVGSVRSQAAAKYDVSAAEVVAAAGLPHAQKEHRKLDEDAIAQCIAAATGLRYVKIDPLKLDNALISKTFSRPFVRRHVVIPIGQEGNNVVLAVADPYDTALRETLRGRAAQAVRLRDLVEARHLRGRRPRLRPALLDQAGRERARRPQPDRGARADGAAPLERGARERATTRRSSRRSTSC